MSSPVETTDDEDFTELRDARIPRVDLVDKAANGLRFLIAKQADGQAGLMDPGLVRDLIGKTAEATPAETAEGLAPAEEKVTMTGSPAAIIKLIHEASVRQQVGKAEMDTADINDLPDSDFAYIEPGGHKDEHGKTTPRSLRHFPIHDAAHVRNALSRAPQSPFGDKAMPKIRAAAKKFGIEVSKMVGGDIDEGIDGLDPTVVLAEPEPGAPGDPTDPGSPAWEAIDAATARKWTSILARAKHAVDLLAERETIEAASGADPDDAFAAMDLEDACCAIDYAISVLAPFAVAEQAEVDCAVDEMAAVGKALAGFDPGPLDTIEALAHVRKAGRVLSSANEAAIRGAVEQLQKVLASLPAAPTTDDGEPVVKQEDTVADTATTQTPETGDDVTKNAPETSEAPVAGGEHAPAEPAATPAPVVKAPQPQVPVYDRHGCLIGVVDPDSLTPVASPHEEEDTADTDDAGEDEPEEAAMDTDLEPAPAADAGIPADDVAKTTTPDTPTTANDTPTDAESSTTDVTKGTDDHSVTQEQDLATQAQVIAQLTKAVEALQGQVKALEEQPAVPGVFTNGAVPPQMRGQDNGAPTVDMAKAAELRKGLYTGPDAPQQHAIATELNGMAITELQRIYSQGPA